MQGRELSRLGLLWDPQRDAHSRCEPCDSVEKEATTCRVCLFPAIASKIIPEGEILFGLVMLSAQTGVCREGEPNHRVAIN